LVEAEAVDGPALPGERRPVRELGTFLTVATQRTSDVLNPALDIIPAERIDVLVTERGATGAPNDERVSGATTAID
jgi:methylthioribose-1-phosphate isomerase